MLRWLSPLFEWSRAAARERILAGTAPAGMRVNGPLNLAGSRALRSLPSRLSATTIDLSDCPRIRRLPDGLCCEQLILRRSGVESLPPDLAVSSLLDAQHCAALRSLPALRVGRLILHGCTALEQIAEGTVAGDLDASLCPRLSAIPASTARYLQHLNVSGCASLSALPDGLGRLETLDASGCTRLEALPNDVLVRRWIEVSGSSLRYLPASLRSVSVLWRGVPVSDRIAFHPDTITIAEILGERNVEIRRTLLDRVGMEWFLEHAQATVLDCDRAAGGERRLLRMPLDGEEDIVCVQVQCPSTGRRYFLRVPPDVSTCQQAVAWTAGFTNPLDYQPAVET